MKNKTHSIIKIFIILTSCCTSYCQNTANKSTIMKDSIKNVNSSQINDSIKQIQTNGNYSPIIQQGNNGNVTINNNVNTNTITPEQFEEIKKELFSKLNINTKSLEEELNQKYPFGFVAFGTYRGDFINTPILSDADLKISADWSKVKIVIDSLKQCVTVGIPDIKMKSSHINIKGQYMQKTFKLVKGESMHASPFFLGGQPNVYFEILNKSTFEKPVYVIGFRIPQSEKDQ